MSFLLRVGNNEREGQDLSEEWNLIIGYYDQLVNKTQNAINCACFSYTEFSSVFFFCTQNNDKQR